jgi:DeoR/GlpR family transcriptional regulator of sugar metabolism
VVLRNSLDVYKVISITTVIFVWMLHWLVSKRTKGLIGEENESFATHLRLQILFVLMIAFDGLITFIFFV